MSKHKPGCVDLLDVSGNRTSIAAWNAGTSTWQRWVYRFGRHGIYLGIVRVSSATYFPAVNGVSQPEDTFGHVMTRGSRFLGRNYLRVLVKAADGTLQTDRITPTNFAETTPEPTFEVAPHEHSTTDVALAEFNGINTLFQTVSATSNSLLGVASLMQLAFVARVEKDEYLIAYRNDYPDFDCSIRLYRLSDAFRNTSRAEL